MNEWRGEPTSWRTPDQLSAIERARYDALWRAMQVLENEGGREARRVEQLYFRESTWLLQDARVVAGRLRR
jgi:hypothetical protein